jgi:hypothetical protein
MRFVTFVFLQLSIPMPLINNFKYFLILVANSPRYLQTCVDSNIAELRNKGIVSRDVVLTETIIV